MSASETYNYKVVRQFSIMTIVWGIVGMTVGVYIAAELVWPMLNFDIPWLTFSRLRPLRGSAPPPERAASACGRCIPMR